MKNQPSLHTRRDFLRTSMLGGAFAYTVPSFVLQTFQALHAAADGSLIQTATGKDGPILLVLQLAGGNDGLNAVVPYTNDDYYRARPTIGIPAAQVLPLNDQLGLNPGLTGFKSLFDAGHLSVVSGVGYPNPNRSHFRATEIWQTASDSDRYLADGWLGRYFDNACTGCDPTVGVNIGSRPPQAFDSAHPTGISVDNPASYRFMGASQNDDEEATFRAMVEGGGMSEESSAGGSIGAVSGTIHSEDAPVDFLERTSLNAQLSSDKIRDISSKTQNRVKYPGSPLSQNLSLVARLIAGGLPTRVFYVSQGGYDTHTNQRNAQDGHLKDLGDSLKAFTEDLQAMGEFDRVMIMTFSEFGRRVTENANKGTDHGAAAPMFLIGSQVKSGLLGQEPSLAPGDLQDGDIKYSTDFRSVYAALLENWLKTPSTPILGRDFQPLPIV